MPKLQLLLVFCRSTRIDQNEEITIAARFMLQEISTTDIAFGHPAQIPPSDRQLQVKYLSKICNRLWQRKSIRTFNGGHPWRNYFEMFIYDMNWNSTMTRAGVVSQQHLFVARYD